MPVSYAIGERFERFVKEQIKSGRYGSESEVLQEALRLMEEREGQLLGGSEPEAVSKDEGPTNFADSLCDRVLALKTRVCVGLDPDLARFPAFLLKKHGLDLSSGELSFRGAADCIVEFNRMVIDAVHLHAAIVKPQSAYYEPFGEHGVRALRETVEYAATKNLPVIMDAKRNDIGSTARKYAQAYLGPARGPERGAIPSDALTINPYLGSDGIKPFVELCAKYGRGVFILVKTSNPSSSELQNLSLRDEPRTLAQQVAWLVNEWGKSTIGRHGYSSVGAVVGATHPKDIRILRDLMPSAVLLMPGYGAQGAGAEDVKDAFKEKGLGAVVNSSRGILYPCPPDTPDFMDRVKEQARVMQEDLNRVAG
ncbi:MAG: orotidine-5'-phosphate decarboxylase [Acidobacteriota bacterium]